MRFASKSIVIQFANFTMLDTYTFAFIRDFCVRFNVPPEVEFTCYDVYPIYFEHYQGEISAKYRQQAIQRNCSEANDLIAQMREHIEKSTMLHMLTIISICSKYIMGPRAFAITQEIKKCLKYADEAVVDKLDIVRAEFCVFRNLQFKVKNIGVLSMVANDDFSTSNSGLKKCVFVLHMLISDSVFANLRANASID